MNNTNIVVSLDTRRCKKDGTYPLIMRLGHRERTASIPLGISLLEKDWDEDERQVRKTYKGVSTVTRLNNIIQKKKAEATDIILKLQESGQLDVMAVTAIRDRIAQQDATQSFFQYTDKLIADLVSANRIGTARSYKGVLSVLKTFVKNKDLSFEQINYSFLVKFEIQHLNNGNGLNGLSVYIRAMRAIYNKAIKEGLIDKEHYPFGDYKIKSAPTRKRALDWEFLDKIIQTELQPGHVCFHARNYFLSSYMMYGMNFADMAFLRRTDIINGRIIYTRKKTGKIYDIKITDSLKAILDYYFQLHPTSDYVFPIIKRGTALLQDKDIMWARKRHNKKLKLLAQICGIEADLTSYVSRHSFATQLVLNEVPINAVSAMLGHSSIKVTEVYIKSLPTNILDNYNTRIFSISNISC